MPEDLPRGVCDVDSGAEPPYSGAARPRTQGDCRRQTSEVRAGEQSQLPPARTSDVGLRLLTSPHGPVASILVATPPAPRRASIRSPIWKALIMTRRPLRSSRVAALTAMLT